MTVESLEARYRVVGDPGVMQPWKCLVAIELLDPKQWLMRNVCTTAKYVNCSKVDYGGRSSRFCTIDDNDANESLNDAEIEGLMG